MANSVTELEYQGVNHTYHNQKAAMIHAAKRAKLEAALFAPVSIDPNKAKALIDQLKSGDRAQIAEANDHLEKAVQTAGDALSGRYNILTERSKMVNSSVMPMMGRVVEVFINQFADELESMDDSWMTYLVTDTIIGASKANIFDIVQGTNAHRLENDTDPIPFSPYKGSTWESVLPEHYGAAIAVSQYIIDDDPMTSINNIVIAIRIALMKKRVEVAFQRINAGIALAYSAGYVTAYTGGSIAQTIDDAYLTLIERNANKGFGLTPRTPVVMTGSARHELKLEAAFKITINSQNANATAGNNGTLEITKPVTRQYSFNFATDLGESGSLMAMILPFRRMRMGNFRGQKIQSEAKIDTNSQNTYGRESFNFHIDETQIQIVTIA